MNRNRVFVKIIEALKKASDDGKILFQNYPQISGVPKCTKVEIKFAKKFVSGWGYGQTEHESNYKALAELYERIVMLSYSPYLFSNIGWSSSKKVKLGEICVGMERKFLSSSNGCAVHSSKKLAIKNAVEELIERHLILKATVLDIPPITVTKKKFIHSIRPFRDRRPVSAFYWLGPLKTYTVVCLFRFKSGYIYGFGCSPVLKEAIKKAYVEISGSLFNLDDAEPEEFDRNKEIDPDDLAHYHLTGKSTRMPDLLCGRRGQRTSSCIDRELRKRDIYVSVFDTRLIFGDEAPGLWFARAVSPKMQPLFFDYWHEDCLNKWAISSYDASLDGDLHVIS